MGASVTRSIPFNYIRQYSGPMDADLVFSSTSARNTYLTSPRRYPGMIVTDTELNQVFFLNGAGTAWIQFTISGELAIQCDGVDGSPIDGQTTFQSDTLIGATFSWIITNDTIESKKGGAITNFDSSTGILTRRVAWVTTDFCYIPYYK